VASDERSVAAFCEVPPPGCFGKRGWICLIPKGLTFLATTKRLQDDENKREVARWCVEIPRGPFGYTSDGRGKGGRNGDTVSRTLREYYRIRYYLSSEK
jgi:hypothetical protein